MGVLKIVDPPIITAFIFFLIAPLSSIPFINSSADKSAYLWGKIFGVLFSGLNSGSKT